MSRNEIKARVILEEASPAGHLAVDADAFRRFEEQLDGDLTKLRDRWSSWWTAGESQRMGHRGGAPA